MGLIGTAWQEIASKFEAWEESLSPHNPHYSGWGGPDNIETEPFDLQELAIKVSNRGVGNPVHIQFRRIVNITLTNTDANNPLTINILDGRGIKTYQIGGGNSAIFKKVSAQSFYFTGNANTVFSYACSWPQETDPNTLAEQTTLAVTVTNSPTVSVSNQVDVNIKQIAEVTVPTKSGGIPIEDGAGGGNLAGVNASGQVTADAVTDIGIADTYAKDSSVQTTNTKLAGGLPAALSTPSGNLKVDSAGA